MNTLTIATLAPAMSGYDSLQTKYAHLLDLIELAAREGAQLVCLPELTNSLTGLPPKASDRGTIEEMLHDGPHSIRGFVDAARRHHMAIVLPVLVKDGGETYNSALFLDETGGLYGRYDKVYPTVDEIDEGVRPGQGPVTVDWHGIRIGFMICFDINYRELAEAYRTRGTRLVLFPTMFDGGALVNSHALLHGMYFVSSYAEWSRFVDPFGRDISGMGRRMESWRSGVLAPVLTRTINFDFERLHLAFNQERFTDIRRAYGHKVQIHVDQGSALAVLESWDEQTTASDIVAEFNLEPLDHYLARGAARAHDARGAPMARDPLKDPPRSGCETVV